jgi:hypothetical protein
MNFWPIITFLGTVFLFATTFSIGVLILLAKLRIIRFKRPTEYMVWGIVCGLLISFIFVTIKCNNSSRNADPVIVHDSSAVNK